MKKGSQEYWRGVREFVAEKHKGQMYGEKPYMFHIEMVVLTLGQHLDLSLEKNIDKLTAAYCHDIIEDQNVTKQELQERFGENVANLVYALSGFGETRAERTQNTINKLNEFVDAIDIKIADRFCNMQCARVDGKTKLMKMYFNELPKYEDVFSQGSIPMKTLLSKEVGEYKSVLVKNKLGF